MIIMLTGGRSCTRLSNKTVAAVKSAADGDASFIVGDCYGADILFQRLLKRLGIDKCTVYHIGYKPRNNAGFDTKRIPGNRYTDKDIAMRTDASHIIHEHYNAGPGTIANVNYFENKRSAK